MADFMYFVPGVSIIGKNTLPTVGLSHALDPRNFSQTHLNGKGPGDQPGVLLGTDPATLKYAPGSEQTWRPCEGGKWWLGYRTAAGGRPTPPDLMRPAMSTTIGYAMKLGDGHEWMIVPCNPVLPTPRLPHRMKLAADGSRTPELLEPYRPYQDRIAALWQRFIEGKGSLEAFVQATSVEEAYAAAEEALALAYRVSKWEIDALALLDSTNVYNVVLAALDFNTLMEVARATAEAEKKRADAPTPDGSSTAPGVPA